MPLSKIDSDSLTAPLTVPAGSAAAPAITTTGDTNTGIFFPAADTIGFAEGGAEAMRITSAGNVGIGTTDPQTKLNIDIGNISGTLGQTNQSNILLSNAGASAGNLVQMLFGYATSATTFSPAALGFISTSAAGNTKGALVFATRDVTTDTAPSERMRIDSSGNLQIGTTDQAFKLSVYETANKVATAIRAVNASYSSSCLLMDAGPAASTGFQFIQARANFNSSASTVFYVFGNGNVQNTNNSYGAISDIKLKENIVDATPKLADLMQVKVRNYNLIGDTTKQIGVVAQELETVFPSLIDITPDKDEEGNDLGTTSKAVKYSVFVPMLIKAIQELKAIVDAQGAEIAALKGTP